MNSIAAEPLHLGLAIVATLGCALVAGVFFAFSTFAMKALARLPPHEGMPRAGGPTMLPAGRRGTMCERLRRLAPPHFSAPADCRDVNQAFDSEDERQGSAAHRWR